MPGHIESVGYDADGKVFYLSNFGEALKPADKDGKGHIVKMSLDGDILTKRGLPVHGETKNKPKGNLSTLITGPGPSARRGPTLTTPISPPG